jgi:hypothetical protein
MAVIMTPPPIPPDGGPPDVPATLTTTYYQQLASHFSLIIDETAAIIPRDNEVERSSSFVKTHLNIPIKFLATAVASVEQVPELRSAGKLDVNKGRDTLQLLDAFRPIRDKMAAFLEDFDNALDSRQADLAVEALEAYHVGQSLCRDESNPTLTAWVANMKRDFGRRGLRGPRPKKPDPVPAPDPVPVPASTIWVSEKPEGRNG